MALALHHLALSLSASNINEMRNSCNVLNEIKRTVDLSIWSLKQRFDRITCASDGLFVALHMALEEEYMYKMT